MASTVASSAAPLSVSETTESVASVEPKAWTHDARRPYFLPPVSATPSALSLISDTLAVAREYRDFVDALGKLDAEYGRSLTTILRKFEVKLDSVLLPHPGSRKPPESTLVMAMRTHLQEVHTVASLHTKRANVVSDQLIRPLNKMERRIGETSRRLGSWSKEVRNRWDSGRERVETARARYHASVRDHEAAVVRFRNCPAPGSGGQTNTDWVKLEKAAAELEGLRADRKRAYIVALAGEGLDGGVGRDLIEGGGDWGWGEEARALYGHIEFTLLDLVKHHAREDRSHNALLAHVYERAEKCYDPVSIAADQNVFLDWNVTERPAIDRTQSLDSIDAAPQETALPTPPDSEHCGSWVSSSPSKTRPPLSLLTPLSPARMSSAQFADGLSSPLTLSSRGDHPTFAAMRFVPPSTAKDDVPTLATDKRADRTWLINRWMQSAAVVRELEGQDGLPGSLDPKRQQIEQLREQCLTYTENNGLGDAEEVWEKRIALMRSLGDDERRCAVAKAEKACLEAVLGPDPGPDLGHDFKEKQFATPSPCDVCGQAVWAPLKTESSCRLCGIALHTKCALHVDPECTGLKSSRRRTSTAGGGKLRRSITSRLRRQSMFESPHGGPQAFRPSPTTIEPLREEELQVSPFVVETDEIARPAIIDAVRNPNPAPITFARVRSDYRAQDTLQLTVWGGEIVRILEPDLDGSGWIRIRRGLEIGDEGLVPLTVLGVAGLSTPPLDGGAGSFVVAAFDFPPPSHSPGHSEARLLRHHLYELSDEGLAYDELWAEVVVPDGSGSRLRGVVPKSYIKPV